MCDESKRAEKPEAQAAATAAPQVKPQGAARKDAVTATPQVAAAATTKPQVTAQLAAYKAATHKAATHKAATHKDTDSKKAQVVDPEFARAENEDDDGYDPYSDRRPVSEPLFEHDPWS